MKTIIPYWMKKSFKYAIIDKIYTTFFLILIAVSYLDLFTNIDLTGGYALTTCVYLTLFLESGYWKWQYKIKKDGTA